MESSKKNANTIGFLTVRKHELQGYVGGLLVLNELARPLEFHCTLPIQTTRSQQILYGPTLDGFVAGEQIARTLMLKPRSQPVIYFTDTLAALSSRHVDPQLIAAVEGAWSGASSALPYPKAEGCDIPSIAVGGYRFMVMPNYEKDLEAIARIVEPLLGASIDLIEPFSRIEEALMEAHPATRAA